MAVAAAKDLPQLSLADAPELTVLVARKDPRRHPRVAARWLLRWLEENPYATIDEAVLAASSLAALSRCRPPGGGADVYGPWPKERLGDGGDERGRLNAPSARALSGAGYRA